MKLWKNFSLEKKYISRQDNIKEIMSFKSTKLINHANKNTLNKKVTFEAKKSLNNSVSSSSIETKLIKGQNKKIENEKNEKKIKINLAQKKFNDLKLLSTSDDFFSNKEKRQKMIYPTITNFNTKKKDNLIKLKIKNLKSPYNNNSLLNKWRENIRKLFNKSLKKTKRDIIQIWKKHKIKNIKKIYQKKMIQIKPTKQKQKGII